VELAAAEAAEEDPAFAPDRVRAAAANLFANVQEAWTAGDRSRLRGLVGAGLLREWERRLDDFERRGWRNRVEVLGAPNVHYVGLARNRDGRGGRVVVRIEATLRDYVVDRQGNRLTRGGRLTEKARIREFWTLGRAAEGWRLLSIEQGAEGRHALQEQVVATPWADEGAMRDEALIEAAAADAVPPGTRIAELADLSFDGDARAAALDLSLVDGRFAPDVLEISARRAVAAWADAVDRDETALRAIAAPEVVQTLLHPGDAGQATRLVVRGPSVRQIRITGFNASVTPPLMTVEVTIEGRRYVEDRATAAVLEGNPARVQTFLERWTFALADDAAQPWRIVSADAPLAAR
jgi:predicted lipid-binding transport protein (Tim44 family)